MSEQIAARRGPPSRRTVVRGSAWAVPAITLATTAPAYASASGQGTLTFNAGYSTVSQSDDGNWQFSFAGASVGIAGRDLQANELTLTVTFSPDPTFSANQLSVLSGGPSGFSQQNAGTQTSVSYLYSGPAPSGSTVPISDGSWFGTAAGTQQVGTFVISIAAPNCTAASYSIHVPPTKRLIFNPGATHVSSVADPYGRGANLNALTMQNASVTVAGGDIANLALTMTVAFVPDAGFSENRLINNGNTPNGWLIQNSSNPRTFFNYLYGQPVSASAHSVTVPISNGTYVDTWLPSTNQQGYFQLTFSAPGFASTTYRAHAPRAPRLTFDPGATTAVWNGSPNWAVVFQGASLTVSGKNLAAGDLTMSVSFEPDAGAPGYHNFGVYPGGPSGWTQQSGLSFQEFPTYHYLSAVNAAATDQVVAISNGYWFQTAYEDSVEYGYIVLTFSAPGCQSTSWRIHVPT